ncbi:MAG: YIP1 family protein [Ignavibacteria bacterium]|nr:YIP1 family protein [Ignavibacteria bacterium]
MMKIVQAERKNFMMFLLFVIGGKFVLNADYLAVHLFHHEGFQLYNLKLVYSGYILIVFLAGLIARLSLKIGKHPIRLKDCYVVIIFSQIPLLASFILLFIPQYILWGRYLFTPDPSPFFLNAVLAFFFSFIELVLVLWSGVLLYHGYKKITNSRVFAITLSVIIFIVIHILPIFLQQKYFPGL